MKITSHFETAYPALGLKAARIYTAESLCHRHQAVFHGEGRTPAEAIRNMRIHARASHGQRGRAIRKRTWRIPPGV